MPPAGKPVTCYNIPMDSTKKIIKLQRLMKKQGLVNLLVTKPENVYYLSGLYSTSAAIIITNKKSYFLTDCRYFLKAQELKNAFELIKVTKGLMKEIIETIKILKINEIAFEENFMNYADYKELKSNFKLIESGQLIECLRMIKDAGEIKYLKKAGLIIKKAMSEIKKAVKPGLTEKEIACKLDCLILKNGADGIAFPTIVASGQNSAIPHHETSEKVVSEGDFVLIDAGAVYNHYCSDMTRTFVAGKPSKKQREILETVKDAQRKALKAIRFGTKLRKLDNEARNLIEYSGYPDCFTHGLGHGIGLDIHEAPPVSKLSEGSVKAGMVFTIEPAIYIDDFGGVRIEDTVYVTKSGVQILT
jgi:Xaa-Pro aminopeptidase